MLDQRTRLGSLSVSPMALGTMYFGTTTPTDVSRTILDRFVEDGGNFLDTANSYAFWVEGGSGRDSETLIGQWLRERGRRDDMVIATKVGASPVRQGGGIADWQGLGYRTIVEDIETSLRCLGTDYVDLYYAHIDDRSAPLDETLRALTDLVQAGKVREIACSNFNSWRIERALQLSERHGYARFAAVQARHSYFQPAHQADFGFLAQAGEKGGRGLEEGVTVELLDLARTVPGFRVLAYSPLLQGAYADPARLKEQYRTNDNLVRAGRLEQVAKEVGATANQVVLAWMMQSDPSIIPLLAVSGLRQLAEGMAAASLRLTETQMDALDDWTALLRDRQ